MSFHHRLKLLLVCLIYTFPSLATLPTVIKSVKAPYKLKTVVIDAGHGGKDPGCSGSSHKEKDVALSVALKLGHYIEQNCKEVKVIYTRSTDVFVELQERAAIANRNNADLFICIHCNANPNKDAHGAETYVMGLHKTKGNLDVAKRENASILLEDNYKKNYAGFDPNSDEANIIFSFYQNAHLEQSLGLAAKIQSQYKEKALRSDKGVKQAGFLVLWKTTMPSLLTETGFLTNAEDEKFLGSATGQDYLALSIFRAFREYKDEMEGAKIKYGDSIDKITPFKGFRKEDSVMLPPSLPAIPTSLPQTPSSIPTPSAIPTSLPQTPVPTPTPIPTASPGQSPSQLTDTANVPVIYFAVQILTSEKPLPPQSQQFKGITGVNEYQDQLNLKYAVGKFKKLEDAVAAQKEIRQKGFPDAFIIAFYKGKKVPVAEAKKLLK